MSPTVVAADWIKQIADDERKRDAVRLSADEAATRKADILRSDGRRFVDELRAAVARDVEAFRDEFAGDSARDITVEAAEPDGGFAVRKPAPSAVFLTVDPNLQGALMICHYRFLLTGGHPPREERVELEFIGGGSETLRMRHQGTGRVFATAAELSEFLLGSVFTGRPR